MRTFVAVALLAVFVSAPALAQPSSGSGASLGGGNSAQPEGSSESGTDANGERRTCRRIPVESSSRMSLRRVCMTRAEWTNYERENR